MIDLQDFIDDGMKQDVEFGIEAKVMLWLNAGTGKVLGVGPRLLAIEGQIQVLGKERPLSVQVSLGDPLLDEDGTVTGPCTLRLGEEADGDAVFRVEGEKLVLLGTLKGTATRIALSRAGQRTQVDIDGERSVQLRLAPG